MRRAAFAVLLAAAACTPSVPNRAPQPDGSASQSIRESLSALLFDDIPAGYVADPEGTRALTIDQAVEGVDDPAELRTRLEQEGFVAGFARLWASDDDATDVIFAYVYEFATADGAKAEQDSGLAEARRDGSETFPVPQISGAMGVTQSPPPGGEGDDSTFHAVSFVRSTRYYLVAIGGPIPHTRQEAIDLAIRMEAVAR